MSYDQDIPHEATETIEFTPAALAKLKNPPVFIIGTPTSRAKRRARKAVKVERVKLYRIEEIREATLDHLRATWSEEDFAKHAPRIESYWEELDEFALQLAADPDLEFAWSGGDTTLLLKTLADVREKSDQIAEMEAANDEFYEVQSIAAVAMALAGWRGVQTPFREANGLVSFDAIYAVQDELYAAATKEDLELGAASLGWAQLVAACARRERLTEEKAGNSASPVPSSTDQAPSSKVTKARGKSPKSGSSTKTPASA